MDKNDIIYDYFQNITGPPSPEEERTDEGNGRVNDYYGDENNEDEKADTPATKIIGPPPPADKEKLPDTGKNKGKTTPKAVMPNNKQEKNAEKDY